MANVMAKVDPSDMTLGLNICLYPIQVDPAKYRGIVQGFRVSVQEDGIRSLAKGWAPTFFGYSVQGLFKYGFYEVFKIMYSNALGEVSINWDMVWHWLYLVPFPCYQEYSYLYRTSLYLAASASCEFFADIALAPMEAVRIRLQTQRGFGKTLREGFPKILKEEGPSG